MFSAWAEFKLGFENDPLGGGEIIVAILSVSFHKKFQSFPGIKVFHKTVKNL